MKRTPERDDVALLVASYAAATFALALLVVSLLYYIAPRIVDQLPQVNIQITPRGQD